MSFEESVRSQLKPVGDVNSKMSYVYVGLIDDKFAYIGKGTGKRYEHLINGSSIRLIKEAQDAGVEFSVHILCDWLTPQEALHLERSAIRALKPLYNLQVH